MSNSCMLPRLTEAVELARRMARRLALRGQQEDNRLPGPTGWEDTEVLRLVRPPSDTAPRVSLKVSSSVNSWHCGKKEGTTRKVTKHHTGASPTPDLCLCCFFLSGSHSFYPSLAHPSRLSSYWGLFQEALHFPQLIVSFPSYAEAGLVAKGPPSCCHATSH